MKLFRVTLTGADDSIRPEQILSLSAKYPWVEWGILFSQHSMGKPRFPSKEWIGDLELFCKNKKVHLSAHICGRWVRDICKGEWTILTTLPVIATDLFKRIQLNFHCYQHKIKDRDAFFQPFQAPMLSSKQLIFQVDGVNDTLLEIAQANDINAAPLFDRSGGAGVLPTTWPNAGKYSVSGYAGGLSPENVEEQIKNIQICSDGLVWIDAETRVRSEDNQLFDLDKVEQFLKNAAPYVEV